MKKHILIIDDDSSIRESLENILTGAGYGVTTKPDGESAQAEFGKADLLMLDLNMPVQDGWDILDHVNAEHPLLPVIAITGLVDQLEDRKIPGASALLEKPIEVPLLLATIKGVLNQTPEQRLGTAEASRTQRHGESRSKSKRHGLRRF